jgi:diaminobutyrate-2-oxoglutarate transaminase
MKNLDNNDSLESNVRYYSRIFPAIFKRAKGSYLFDISDKKYLDFFSGAGALNYGHNNSLFKEKLISYIQSDGITHSLDMMTEAKNEFMNNFQNLILKKRGLNYKMQFTGPTGTDAIEAALKLARKYTGRKNIISFSDSFHGMSMGSLAITSKRNRIGIPVGYTIEFPFYRENSTHNFDIETYLKILDKSEYPAAIVIETIQAEGGINVASIEWLRHIEKIANKYKILLIIDDVQVGVGRSGDFFSFERANITPDIVCLSKSISGYGIPLSIVLIKPLLDIWEPGEHTGTFRGVNLAFITANEALLNYWNDDKFSEQIKSLSKIFKKNLNQIAKENDFSIYGLGFIFGIDVGNSERASQIRKNAFDNGLVFEVCGPKRSIIKMIPPLTTTLDELEIGLNIFKKSLY